MRRRHVSLLVGGDVDGQKVKRLMRQRLREEATVGNACAIPGASRRAHVPKSAETANSTVSALI